VIADRFDNRAVQITTQLAFAGVALSMWLIVATGVVQVWMVYALSFVSGLVTAVDMPTRQSFYLEMVGADALTNAMSLNTATFTGSRILGSALAGVLIANTGFAIPFLVNGISYLAVVAALAAMRVGDLHPRQRVGHEPGQIRAAIRYVARTRTLRLPMLTMLVVFLFAFNFIVYLPLLVTRTFHESAGALGALLSLWGIGSLTGALVMASRSSRPNPQRLAGLAIALGVLSVLLALSPSPEVAAVVVVPLGAAFIAFAITGNSTLQLSSSDAMRGRVMALYSVVFLGSTPIGAPLVGWLAEAAGPRAGLWAGAAAALAAAAGAAWVLRPQGAGALLRSPARG
jgi:predicted MFS family arabinose efflux permease